MKSTSGSHEPSRTEFSGSEPGRILYGGSFDPPHKGHARNVEKVLRRFPRATVEIVVAAAPAGAYGQHKTTSASFEDRLEMCRLNFYLFGGQVRVNPIEASLEAPNYTWRTLDALRATDKEAASWALLMGQDQFESFPGWKKADELIDKADIVLIDREGYEGWAETEAKFAKNFFSIKKIAEGIFAWVGKKGRIYRIEGDTTPEASRILRRGTGGHESWLKDEVLAYITSKDLYPRHEG